MSDTGKQTKGGAAPANEDEIASKLISISYKRFYVDVKQNSRGRFIKIAEMNATHKSRVVMSMNVAAEFVEKAKGYLEFMELTPEESPEETKNLKNDVLHYDTRRYYIDLKENARGRFLRLAQTTTMPRPTRSTVAIPAQGLKEVLDVIAEFIEKFGEGFMDGATETTESRTIKGEFNKHFYFDKCENERGSYIRITEAKMTGFRQAITVPTANLVAFRNMLTELIDKDGKTDCE